MFVMRSRKTFRLWTILISVFTILCVINSSILLSRRDNHELLKTRAKSTIKQIQLGDINDDDLKQMRKRTTPLLTDNGLETINREQNIKSDNTHIKQDAIKVIEYIRGKYPRIQPNNINDVHKIPKKANEKEKDTVQQGNNTILIGNKRWNTETQPETNASLDYALRHKQAMEKLVSFKYLETFYLRLFHVIGAFTGPKYSRVMGMFDHLILDLWNYYKTNTTFNRTRWDSWDEDAPVRHHEIDCSNIHQINITKRLGGGYIKVAYEGEFHGKKVVVKWKNMKNNAFAGVCGWENFTCAVYRDVRILNELLLLDHMDHPMFIPVLGYCIHGGLGTADFLTDPGVVGVYEYGQPVKYETVADMDLQAGIKFATDIADFLDYVEHSPFGRLTLYDLEVHQFVRIGDYICLSDLDLADNMEDPMCKDVLTNNVMSRRGLNITVCQFKIPFSLGYSFDVPCVDGVCLHVGQIHNLKKLYFGILNRLLYWDHYPKIFQNEVSILSGGIQAYMPASVLKQRLHSLLDRVGNRTRSDTG